MPKEWKDRKQTNRTNHSSIVKTALTISCPHTFGSKDEKVTKKPNEKRTKEQKPSPWVLSIKEMMVIYHTRVSHAKSPVFLCRLISPASFYVPNWVGVCTFARPCECPLLIRYQPTPPFRHFLLLWMCIEEKKKNGDFYLIICFLDN